jgi:hypothetical protein
MQLNHSNADTISFDEAFYLRSYPQVKEELTPAIDARAHYLQFGRARGYLPHREAPRADDAARMDARFGGLWVDQPNAWDLIAGRLEIGAITGPQATLLRQWLIDGYVILPGAIPARLVDAAAADLDRAFRGGFETMLFESPLAPGPVAWQQAFADVPSKALDLHHFSLPVRNLIFHGMLAEFLQLIFESKAFASQTLGFLRGSAQDGHQDSAYVPYTLPRQFAASWIALEDVKAGAGELFYYPGSHRFPDFLYGGQFKSVSELARAGGEKLDAQVDQHVRELASRAKSMGMKKKTFIAKKGDVLIWHADLVHGGCPISQDATRKSVVTHYCPRRLSPLFSEQTALTVQEHEGHRFTSSYYPGAALPGCVI